MVNILPKEDRRALVTAYYTRLLSSFFLIGTGIMVIGGALLAPSYILLSDSSASFQRFTEALTQTLSLKSKTNDANALAALSEAAALVNENAEPPELGILLAGITGAKTKNITLGKIGFIFQGGGGGAVNISGHAATREALVAFVDALRVNTIFQGVSVPVENLASGTDIAFTFSFTFKLK